MTSSCFMSSFLSCQTYDINVNKNTQAVLKKRIFMNIDSKLFNKYHYIDIIIKLKLLFGKYISIDININTNVHGTQSLKKEISQVY